MLYRQSMYSKETIHYLYIYIYDLHIIMSKENCILFKHVVYLDEYEIKMEKFNII